MAPPLFSPSAQSKNRRCHAWGTFPNRPQILWYSLRRRSTDSDDGKPIHNGFHKEISIEVWVVIRNAEFEVRGCVEGIAFVQIEMEVSPWTWYKRALQSEWREEEVSQKHTNWRISHAYFNFHRSHYAISFDSQDTMREVVLRHNLIRDSTFHKSHFSRDQDWFESQF